MSNKMRMSKEQKSYPTITLKSYYMITKRARKIIDQMWHYYFDSLASQKKYK